MCLCRSERTSFTNGNLKGSINAGRYTADYLQCGNLPYLAWKNAHNCADLSYRRIRRYLVWRLKRLEARDFSRVRIKFLIHKRYIESFANLQYLLQECDLAVFYDNTDRFHRFAIFHKGKLVRLSQNVPDWFKFVLDKIYMRPGRGWPPKII